MDYAKEVERLAREAELKTRNAAPSLNADGPVVAPPANKSRAPTPTPAPDKSEAAAGAQAAPPTLDELWVKFARAVIKTGSDQAPSDRDPNSGQTPVSAQRPQMALGRWVPGGIIGFVGFNFLSSGARRVSQAVEQGMEPTGMIFGIGTIWVAGILLLSAWATAATPAGSSAVLARRLRVAWVIIGVLTAVGALGTWISAPR